MTSREGEEAVVAPRDARCTSMPITSEETVEGGMCTDIREPGYLHALPTPTSLRDGSILARRRIRGERRYPERKGASKMVKRDADNGEGRGNQNASGISAGG